MNFINDDKRKLDDIRLKIQQEKSRKRYRARKATSENLATEIPIKAPIGYIMLTVLIAITYPIWCTHHDENSAAKNQRHDIMDALYSCQQAIKQHSLIPNESSVPYREGTFIRGGYYFSWPRSAGATARNVFGEDIPISASCIVDAKSMSITSLTINGDDYR